MALHGFSFRSGDFQPLSQYSTSGKYGRMFPQLPPLFQPTTLCEADEIFRQLEELGEVMIETEEESKSPEGNNENISAGYTYLGQFIDHDITFDPTSLGEIFVDPLALKNFRTARLDLDSVYSSGPKVQPYLYERNFSGQKITLFKIGMTRERGNLPSSPDDLPRSGDGFALIGDPRNDENLIVAQLHLVFLKFHNKVVEKLQQDEKLQRKFNCQLQSAGNEKESIRDIFEIARQIVVWHYQWIVLYDYLPTITNFIKKEEKQKTNKEVIDDLIQRLTQETNDFQFHEYIRQPFIPVEFSTAAFRFGHSKIRSSYRYNRKFNRGSTAKLKQLLAFTGFSSNHHVPIPSNWVIDWRNFFKFEDTNITPNPSRKINPFLTQISPNMNLAIRDLKRGMIVNLPSGQAVAEFLGFKPLTETDMIQGPDYEIAEKYNFHCQSPLWYYILKEAEKKEDGECLGDLGSYVVAKVFIGLLLGDSHSFLVQNKNWKPEFRNPRTDSFTMVDLINFVNDVNSH